MEKMIRNKFWRKVRAMVVAAGAVMMVAGNCWGYKDQSTITINPNVPAAHGIRENVVYAVPGKPKRIEFQDISNDNNKLDGYVRWYVEDGGNVTTNDLSPLPGATNMIKYANGYVWLRNASTVTVGADTYCWAINYTLPPDKDEVVVVCEASSLNNGTTSGNTFTAPMVTVVRRYTVRKASVISSELSSKKTNLDNNYSTWRTNISALAKAEENTFRESSANFIESYEIHTSLSQGTNYRLGEILSNYYVGSTEATDIRWSAFNADGTLMTEHIASELSKEQNKNGLAYDMIDHPSEKLYIWKHKFTKTEGIDPYATTTQVIYITAEVTTDKTNYYPAMFLKVYLEPFTEPLTQTELNTNYKNNANYYLRFYDHLAQDQYQQIVAVNFDEIDSENKPMTWNELKTSQRNNFSTKPVLNEETAYAFTNPLQYAHRKANRITAGQGEYGLYRTLNYTRDGIAVSPDRTELEINDGGTVKPQYQEAWVPGYNKYMVDRLFDETKGTANEKYGFFYFLDATDDPGTVVKIHLNSELCNNTQLVVSAWICDTKMGSGFDADLGIAFIGRKKADDPSTEVVLNRFYSGEIYTKPPFNANPGSGEYEQAQWQQIYYTFTIPGNVGDYEEYYVEILNNAPSTAGADYAVDDIRVYKSTPNVQVKRDNECDASTLIVGTDYATILRNMGWTPGELVANEQDFDNFTDVEFRKYRYGLMGKDHKFKNSTAGNVYFAFVEQDLKTWKVVNKQAQNIEGVEKKNPAAMSLRVAVSTVQDVNQFEFYVGMTDNSEEAEEKAKEQAQLNERIMNYRAVKDYLADYNNYWKNIHAPWPSEIDINNIDPESNNFDEDKYQEAMVELFARRLEIPRLRCPWYDKTNKHLYLAIIDVNNTDLKYNGQINADGTSSDGTYWVVTFSAEEVAGHGDEQGVINVKSECTLKSLFTIDPATTVLIDAVSPGDPDIAVCMGTVHEIVAYLNFYDKDTQAPIPAKDTKDLEYIFDWYLGSLTEYDGLTTTNGFSVKEALNAYRTAEKNSLYPIEKSDLQTWTDAATDGSEEKKMGTLLLDLMDNGKLLLGTLANEPFDMPINTERMVAMPYLPEVKVEDKNYDFCSAETEVNLQAVSPDNPEIFQGFVKVEYGNYTDVALRLGQPNMDGTTTLNLPIHKVSNMADNATRLGLALNSIDITLIDESGTPHTVGTATSLNIPKTEGELTTQATLTFSLNATAKEQMQEGSSYTLLIPFVQYAGDTQLNRECDGTLELPVKVVPEYLTWKGAADDDWYDDKKWNQSTNRELHLGEPVAQDANGSDIVTNAFSPLYFSNITILGDTLGAANRELQLDNTITKDDNQEGTLSITDNIKYDLAVADKDGKITPYYIYNVDEIYFKPGATLLNQHLLGYTEAHVEFTMTKSQPYWMASPLQDVYAGDMYAPVKGKQHTPAFEPITYSTAKNDRWNMPFYQKAWNKAIAYMDENNTTVDVPRVESNWNIEYNDVWVPYTIGKGFYSRVEERDALVRLPKDDADYSYETKAGLSEKPTSRPNAAGKLANTTNGSITLDLSTVDNDGDHFLIGNPYMAYLDMSAFLGANTNVLANKYWTVDGNKGVIVGTPDVVWPDGSELTSGYIAPMQAFFVERVGYDPNATKADGETTETKKVTFNASMTVSATNAETKAFAATNPVLTLTASSKQGQSRAAVVQKSDASNQYEADKDAVALLDSEIDAPMAYTVAGNYAAAVNAIHDYKNVPLGVYAKDGEEVELTIEGASQLVSPLYLYDAVTRSTTPIEGDSYTLSLTGSSHGRYFLTTDEGIKAEGDIRIYSPADGQLIIASTPSDRLKQVQVYDLNGRMVESRQNVGTATCQLYVAGGIYIVRVQSEQGEAQAKLKIK